jgi:teichuronic acid biosynthesis glycosyltransferase TuaC
VKISQRHELETSAFPGRAQLIDLASLRILTYTNLYPNRIRPNFGIFIRNRMGEFVRQTQARLDVVSPVPYFPKLPWPERWSAFGRIQREEHDEGIHIYHPRYVVIPKVGMRTHGPSLYWATRKEVYRLHQQNSYHLIDAHWVYPDGWAAVKIARELSLPVVVSARGNDITEFPDYPSIRPSIIWCLKNCDHIISVTEALKNLMVDLGIPGSKITAIGNGVNIQRFHPVLKAEARRRLSLPLDEQLVLTVGNLEPGKGQHLLIEAIHLLRDQNRVVPKLYIVGRGFFHDKLKTQILKLGLEKRAILVGEVANQDLKFWYSAADVFCLASDREGWPNVLLEAMACGTPVVVTKVFGIPEIVSSSEVGMLVEERTPHGFAKQIQRALSHPWDSTKIVEFARQHTWDKTARRVSEVFLNVLDHG